MIDKNFVLRWNNTYRVDFYWRRKNGVIFGSEKHKSMDFESMLFDLIEEHLIKSKTKEKINPEDDFDFRNSSVLPMTEKEIDDEFDKL